MKEIPLTQGKVALVDDADFAAVATYRWYACLQRGRWYAMRAASIGTRRTSVYLHRLILEAKPGEEVDHISHDGLDNRRANLRFVTRSQNNANQRKRKTETYSCFKGVTWDKHNLRWIAQIQVERKRAFLGRFDSETDAARAYDAAAERAWGFFAHTNF